MKKLTIILSIFLYALTAQGQTYNFPLNEWHTLNGAQVAPDPTFDLTGTQAQSTSGTYWITEANMTISSGAAHFSSTPNVNELYQTSILPTTLDTYIISFTISNYSAGGVEPRIAQVYGTAATGNGDYQYELTGTTANNTIGFRASGTTTLDIENVTVRLKNAFSQETQTGALGTAVNIYPTLDDKGSGARWYELGGDASDDYMSIPDDASLDGFTEFSIFAMVRTNTVTTEGIISKYSSNGNLSYTCYIDGNGNIVLGISTDGSAVEEQVTTTAPISVDTWYKIAVFFNAGTFTVFVNEDSQAVNDDFVLTSVKAGTVPVLIGARTTATTSNFDGDIAMVRMFNDDQTANMAYYSIPSNPIKAADITSGACVLNLTASGLRSNQWYDELNEISATNNGAIAVIPSTSNLGATQFTGEGATAALDSYIEIDDLVNDGTGAGTGPLSNTTQGTWMTEIWISDETPVANSVIISFGDKDVAETINIYIETTGKFAVDCKDNAVDQFTVKTDVSLSYGKHNVCLVQNGVIGIDPILYVDGIFVAQTESVGVKVSAWFTDLTGLDNGRIGSVNLASIGEVAFFDGTIRDARFWDTALSASEVLEESGLYRNR